MIAYHKVLTDAQKYIKNILCITVNHHEPDLNKSQKTRPKTPTASKVIPLGSRITILWNSVTVLSKAKIAITGNNQLAAVKSGSDVLLCFTRLLIQVFLLSYLKNILKAIESLDLLSVYDQKKSFSNSGNLRIFSISFFFMHSKTE